MVLAVNANEGTSKFSINERRSFSKLILPDAVEMQENVKEKNRGVLLGDF